MKEWFVENWKPMAWAFVKALWPFVAGLFGGITAGCSFCGSGIGVTL